MFRTAELGRKVDKQEYRQREPVLREDLLQVQQELRLSAKFPVLLVFAGVDGAGKAQTVNLLNAWMDPRWLLTRAYDETSDEERERPPYWRYWRDIPPRGRIGMFLHSWYSRPILDKVYGKIDLADFDERLDRIIAFEKALTDDGAVILKFWMHLSREAQKKRLKSLEKDPATRWQVRDTNWEHWGMYDRFLEAAERTIMRTSTGPAPFTIVEGVDPYYRSLTVGQIVRDAIRRRLDEATRLEKLKARLQVHNDFGEVIELGSTTLIGTGDSGNAVARPAKPLPTVLSALDMSNGMGKADYEHKLNQYQGELNFLQRKALQQGISTLIVFEGPDAAGKGSAIRRITAALDASNYQIIPFAAPTDEEQAHHYLWRFWRHLSRAGRFTIYDRSWYGRVLVERVEGFAGEVEWRRAYNEINDFEDQLIEHGIVLLKYWLHITQDEQLLRFQDREQIPHKRWKLTPEDWRNREKWEDYELAVHDMVQYTSTHLSPWILVEGNNKYYARLKILKTLCRQLEKALGEGKKTLPKARIGLVKE
jgi:polyphosphate kinase 2 (PPK2 family)